MSKKSNISPSLFEAHSENAAESTIPTHKMSPTFPLPSDIPASWLAALGTETLKPYWDELQSFVAAERATQKVYPPAEDVFNAFRFTPLDSIKALILGQDPYPGVGHAHGLCFSVRPGVRVPGSLRNIYQELNADLGIEAVKHGYLASWAKQGILMLNACLTVRADSPNSHAGKGWEKFTDAVIAAVNQRKRPVVFLLWGAYAQKKIKMIDGSRHVIIKSAHPSPLSASNGFFGSRPFSKINEALTKIGESPIEWRLPETVSKDD